MKIIERRILMDRRRFLNLLGMATVGGAVAYSFPDIIVPKNIILPDQTWYNTNIPAIDFRTLNNAYQKACIGNSEPKLILVNKNTYAYIMQMLEPQLRFVGRDGEGLRFRASEIRINEYLNPGQIVTI